MQNICCGYFAFDRTQMVEWSHDQHNTERHNTMWFKVMA